MEEEGCFCLGGDWEFLLAFRFQQVPVAHVRQSNNCKRFALPASARMLLAGFEVLCFGLKCGFLA